MKYLKYPARPGLAPFIKCYWSLSDFSLAPGGHQNQFLTEGGMELLFRMFAGSHQFKGENAMPNVKDSAVFIKNSSFPR
jgi:hypothetical protein